MHRSSQRDNHTNVYYFKQNSTPKASAFGVFVYNNSHKAFALWGFVDFEYFQYYNCFIWWQKTDWSKCAAKIKSDKYIFDVHWYEYDGIQYETKLKYRKERKREN